MTLPICIMMIEIEGKWVLISKIRKTSKGIWVWSDQRKEYVGIHWDKVDLRIKNEIRKKIIDLMEQDERFQFKIYGSCCKRNKSFIMNTDKGMVHIRWMTWPAVNLRINESIFTTVPWEFIGSDIRQMMKDHVLDKIQDDNELLIMADIFDQYCGKER